MSSLTDEQVEKLNNWARTEPALRATFPYTEGREGLGDALNTESAGGGGGFYGITVKQTDDAASFSGIDVISFEAESFYITQNAGNTDEAVVNFRGSAGGDGIETLESDSGSAAGSIVAIEGAGGIVTSASGSTLTVDGSGVADGGFYGIVVKDDSTVVVTDSIEFDGDDFDVSASGDGASVTLDASVAKLSDIPPGFYGIAVKDDSTLVVTDSIEFSGSDFDVSASGDGALVELDASVAKVGDIGPGFYGIMVKQSDDLASFSGIDVISFDTNDFYLTQNAPNTDEVQVNTRGMVVSGGRPGGQTITGDTSTSGNGLILRASPNSQGFDNTLSPFPERITVQSGIQFQRNNGGFLANGNQVLISTGSAGDLVQDGRSNNINTLQGFQFVPKTLINSTQLISLSAAFNAGNTFEETSPIDSGSHFAFQLVGFSSSPKYNIAHNGATTADIPLLAGFNSNPIVKRSSTDFTGTVTVSQFSGFETFSENPLRTNPVFDSQQVNAGVTVDSLAHFRAVSSVGSTGLVNNGGTITEEIGLDLVNIDVGSTVMSVRSTGVNATMRHAGDVIIGATDLPAAELEVRGRVLANDVHADSVVAAGFYLFPDADDPGTDFSALVDTWISFHIPDPVVENYWIDLPDSDYRIKDVGLLLENGDVTLSFYIRDDNEGNGILVDGLDAITSLGTARLDFEPDATTVVGNNQEVIMSVHAVTLPAKHLRGRMRIRRR